MLEKQSQGPQCTACGSPMKLSAIEPGSTGQDLRTFTCPICKKVQAHFMESIVRRPGWSRNAPSRTAAKTLSPTRFMTGA
jgi:hypothetical protein